MERGRNGSGSDSSTVTATTPATPGGWSRVDLDVRDRSFAETHAPVLRAASHAGEREYVHVRARGVSWPLMAALQAAGQTYRFSKLEADAVEFVVWRRYSPEQRRRYLDERVGLPIYSLPLRGPRGEPVLTR